ncbi:hypothetical protein OEZ85_002903 [Tetradesmus obliquus]|uniref:Peptidase C1A papain C-terminal domain-containing protein n=1 Tax=Tetradesmus obliquus TaxID=3088 RepID=A0ABY8TZR9_TETOB|nr:hypothetical protein OEZ85_002903 [Tetradesmus obliquus]
MTALCKTIGALLLLQLVLAGALPAVEPEGMTRRLMQSFDRSKAWPGLTYAPKGLKSAPNAMRRSYSVSRGRARVVANLGAGINVTQLAQAACNTTNVADPSCEDVLLLALTPARYSSNNTADTSGRRALISPAQDQGTCSSCVGFAVTAAAEAAVNAYKQQSWDKLGLSEQDLIFCMLPPHIDCVSGASYDEVVKYLNAARIAQWAPRDCFPYLEAASSTQTEDCDQLKAGLKAGECSSQLPEGGAFTVADAGSPLATMARAKEQIMLTGGVFTSMAMSSTAFGRFAQNKTAASGTFVAIEDASKLDPSTSVMHAVFCYGWWDRPGILSDGYWICKNSWGPGWGLGGSFRVAYGSAFIMQPDHTFAMQFNKASLTQRVEDIKQRLGPDLSNDQSGCVLYTPKQPTRMLQLVRDLSILSTSISMATRPRKADILADVLASNLGFVRNVSAASNGPFRLCGKVAPLLTDIISGVSCCSLSRASDPACKRCVQDISIGLDQLCVVLFDGSVECAGSNNWGQSWRGSAPGSSKLVTATALTGMSITDAGGGYQHSCAVTAVSGGSNKVFCVGDNMEGQLGDGTGNSSKVPVEGLCA